MSKLLARIHDVAPAYTRRHFVYSNGDHGSSYFDYRPLGQLQVHYPLLREASLLLFRKILKHAKLDLDQPITVVGPKTLGALMANQVFFAPVNRRRPLLPKSRLLQARTLQKNDDTFAWVQPAENAIDSGTQVIFLDDVLNATSTFENVRLLVNALGTDIAAIGVIGDRSGNTAAELGVRHIASLERFKAKRYSEAQCPHCKRQEPIVNNRGHGRAFEQIHPDYPGGFVSL